VDDDEVDILAVKRSFSKSKIDNPIHVARDGLEALAMLRGEDGHRPLPTPYVIVLDMHMPRMDGLECLEQLRGDPVHRRAVVFALTSSTDARHCGAAYDYNVAGCLIKSRTSEDFQRFAEMLQIYRRTIELPSERTMT
jgi:CheY-like chemotaxis protein